MNALAAAMMLTAVATGVADEKPQLTNSTLTLQAGDYKLQIAREGCWTMESLAYKGTTLVMDTGANQSVIKLKPRPDLPAKYEWIGTKHGGEEIESLQLEVDGVAYPVKVPMDAPAGDVYTFVKVSRFGPYRAHWSLTLSEEGLTENAKFEAVEDTSQIAYAYIFMHCWNPSMKEWAALGDGVTLGSGTIDKDNPRALETDITSAAVFSPTRGIGGVIAYPKVYKGVEGRKSFMKYREGKYNKLYLCVNPVELETESYECKVEGFTATSETWKKTAYALMQNAYTTASK